MKNVDARFKISSVVYEDIYNIIAAYQSIAGGGRPLYS